MNAPGGVSIAETKSDKRWGVRSVCLERGTTRALEGDRRALQVEPSVSPEDPD